MTVQARYILFWILTGHCPLTTDHYFNGMIFPRISSAHSGLDPIQPLAPGASPLSCCLDNPNVGKAESVSPFPIETREHVPGIVETRRWSAAPDPPQCCSE